MINVRTFSKKVETNGEKETKVQAWKSSENTIIETVLFKITNYGEVMINPDDDNALKLLLYCEQNSMGDAQ